MRHAFRYICLVVIPVCLIAAGGMLYAETLTLEESIIIARKNSIKLHALKSSIAISRKLIHESWRDLLPVSSIQYQKDDEIAYRENDMRSHSLSCNVSYDINTSGRSILTYQVSKIESLLAESEYIIEQSNIILNVKKAYYDLQKKQHEIKINQKLLNSLYLQQKIVSEQKKLGMATDLQQIQVDAKISEAKYAVLTSKNDYDNSLRDFANLLGLSSDAEIILSDMKHSPEELIGFPQKKYLIALGLKKRNEIYKSNYTLLKSEKELSLAEYYYLPKFQLFGSYGYTGKEFPLRQKTWTVGVSVTTALFGNSMHGGQTFGEKDNGNTRTSSRSGSVKIYDNPSYARKIIEAETSYSEAVKSHQQLRRSIANEISRSYDNLIQSIKRIQMARENVNLLEKQVTIENEKVRLGDITRHDVLRTFIELNQAQLRQQSAITDYYIAIAALENAAGVPIGSLVDDRGKKNEY